MANAQTAPAGRILILNPLGNGSTSRKRAKAYVHRGLADWVERGVSIRFHRQGLDHRERSAQISVGTLTGLNYDRIDRLLQPREAANIPVVQAWRLYGCGQPTARGGNWIASLRGVYARPTPEAL